MNHSADPACDDCDGTGIDNQCRWANEESGDECDGCPCPTCAPPDRTTATGSTLLDRLTFPYWYLLEQWSLLRLDPLLGIRGPWWRRQAKRRAFWDEFARHGGWE